MQTIYAFFGFSSQPDENLFTQTTRIERNAQKKIQEEVRTKTKSAVTDFKDGKQINSQNYKLTPQSPKVNHDISTLFDKKWQK